MLTLTDAAWPAWHFPSVPSIDLPGVQLGPRFTAGTVILGAALGLATVAAVAWALTRKG